MLVVVVGVLALVAAGCGGDDGEATSEPEAESGGATEAPAVTDAEVLEGDQVEILAIDNSFDPEATEIAAGTEVTWVNNGRNDHNVIPEDEDAEWRIESEDFAPGDAVSYTFDEPGTYRYYCSIHGTIDAGMPGVLVVE